MSQTLISPLPQVTLLLIFLILLLILTFLLPSEKVLVLVSNILLLIVSYSALSHFTRSFALALSSVMILHSVFEALSLPKWKAAMEEDMRALEKNGTWDIVDLLADKEPVGC